MIKRFLQTYFPKIWYERHPITLGYLKHILTVSRKNHPGEMFWGISADIEDLEDIYYESDIIKYKHIAPIIRKIDSIQNFISGNNF